MGHSFCGLLVVLSVCQVHMRAIEPFLTYQFIHLPCSLGGLLILSPVSFDMSHHVLHSSSLLQQHTQYSTPFFSLHIPFSKTTGTAGAIITITKLSTVSDIRSCPFVAL